MPGNLVCEPEPDSLGRVRAIHDFLDSRTQGRRGYAGQARA